MKFSVTDADTAALAVRRATRADVSQYSDSLRAAATEAGWSLAQVETCLGDSLCELWIAEELGVPHAFLGYPAVRAVLDELEVLSLAVLPEKRRRGLGRRLLSSVLDAWRWRGAKRVFLEVRASNAPACSLYQGLGFAEVGRRQRSTGTARTLW